MKIALVASEIAPFAKTGGLADVCAAIPRFLERDGHECLVVMPLYGRVRRGEWTLTPKPGFEHLQVRLGREPFTFGVWTSRLPGSRLDVHFVDSPRFYGGDEIYGSGADEALRFAFLSQAALKLCQHLPFAPDVVHCNDWHTALLPLHLRTEYAWDELFEHTKTVLTLHNLAYQGVFSADLVDAVGLGPHRHLLHQEDLAENRLNFLKTGILYASALTTVSETYAREIQTPAFGMGLDRVLRQRSDSLFGIVNGVDYGEWDPADDRYLPHRYGPGDLAGKRRNRVELLRVLELAPDPRGPLLGIVSRLTGQKGFDLLPDVLPVVLQEDVRLAILGTGEERYVGYFRWLEEAFPTRVAFYEGYNDELAHRIEAAADVFLMPSRFEPCGLNQMYSLRYGTVPVVRRTGGLADTVVPWDPETGEGTGFLFDEFHPDALFGALRACLSAWRDQAGWKRLVANGMAQDFSWDRQGRHYVRLYERLQA